jgi:hypothetical protein
MKIIPTRIHGILDYLVGLIFIASPVWLQTQTARGAETRIFVVLGVAALIYSLCTRYELGPIKLLPMGAHLGLDIASGLLLMASPWLFGFADRVYLPHVLFGIFEIGTALLTRTHPEMVAGGEHAPAH